MMGPSRSPRFGSLLTRQHGGPGGNRLPGPAGRGWRAGRGASATASWGQGASRCRPRSDLRQRVFAAEGLEGAAARSATDLIGNCGLKGPALGAFIRSTSAAPPVESPTMP
jgi:hypothetical protein